MHQNLATNWVTAKSVLLYWSLEEEACEDDDVVHVVTFDDAVELRRSGVLVIIELLRMFGVLVLVKAYNRLIIR